MEILQKETSHRVVAVDSTWYLPNMKKDGFKEFLEVERIPGAVYFDIDGVKDTKSPYPHMLPDSATFNKYMSKLGIQKNDILVVYDRIGNFSAPRCAWTLGIFGHKQVYLLNNFPKYKELKLPLDTSVQTEISPYKPSNYESDVDLTAEQVVNYDEMLQLVKTNDLANSFNVFDARALPRFTGENPEPRPDIPSGHIPGAQPMPFTAVVANGLYEEDPAVAKQKLQDYLSSSNCKFDPSKPTIAMCGTGVTGVIIKTAMEAAGIKNIRLYDGSWTEWAMRSDPKYVAKGAI